MKKPKPKPKAKSRTSIWLDNDLRNLLEKRCERESRSLASAIDVTLREGLAKLSAKKAAPDATVFG